MSVMNRRRFAKILTQHSLSAWAAVGVVPAMAYVTLPDNRVTTGANTIMPRVGHSARPLIKPAKLNRGDLVGLIAPSGATDIAFVEQRVKNLEAFGLKQLLKTRVRYGGAFQP